MKRYGNLWSSIIDFENILIAAKKAQRGKRFRENILAFNHNLESELFQLQTELESKTYCPGEYHTFILQESKKRLISAAPYRDRVVHHALCNIITPIFESTLISDTYANRTGFGTHRALKQFIKFSRSSKYVLQCDIRKYFPSIDHEILKSIIRRKIKCKDTLWLIDTIIDHSNAQEPIIEYFPDDDLLSPFERRRGLPIGNLTSQFFANIYLSGFDHFVKETLKSKKYLRYVDDFALFSDDWQFLADARLEIESYLSTLRLKIHPIKSQLSATQYGTSFVGFRIFPTRIRVRTENLRRARKRLRKLQQTYTLGSLSQTQLHNSLKSWFAHLRYANTWNLRQRISSSLILVRG
jgi:retron-type reverse transcriptase